MYTHTSKNDLLDNLMRYNFIDMYKSHYLKMSHKHEKQDSQIHDNVTMC